MSSPASPRIVMVNSGKAEAVDQLLRVAPDADVDVITEAAYAKQYAPDVRLHFVDDIGDLTAIRRVALDLLAQGPIDYVVSPSERSQQPGGYLRSFLGLPGIPFDVANRFSNKAVMKATFAHHSIPTAPFRVVPDLDAVAPAAAELRWPVVVKPSLGTGSMNTFAVSSSDDWEMLLASGACDALRHVGCPLIVEHFIAMDGEYHCDGLVRNGKVVFAAASRYLSPLLGRTDAVTGSYLLPFDDPAATRLLDLHARVVASLGLDTGVTHFEAFKTPGGFLAGEIACRPAGGGIVEAIRLQYGRDLWRAFMEASLDRLSPVLPPAPPRPQIIVNCDLPIRPGKVLRISTAEELSRLPGVVSACMTVHPGDVIGPRLHSASTTGLVFFSVPDCDAVADHVARLATSYVLDVDPAPGI